MSVLLAAVSGVLATPVPTPSPIVVHDTITKVVTVVAASPQLVGGLELAGLALAGYLASVLHGVFEKLSKRPDGWSRGFNVALQVCVGLAVSAVAGLIAGTLVPTLRGVEDFLGSFLIVMGSSQTRYTFFKWVQSLGSGTSAPNPVDKTQQDNAAAEAVIPQKASL